MVARATTVVAARPTWNAVDHHAEYGGLSGLHELYSSRDSLDPFVRKNALRQLHAKVHEDVPMVFLWTLDSYAALSVKLRNVVVHPFYFFTWVTDWQMK